MELEQLQGEFAQLIDKQIDTLTTERYSDVTEMELREYEERLKRIQELCEELRDAAWWGGRQQRYAEVTIARAGLAVVFKFLPQLVDPISPAIVTAKVAHFQPPNLTPQTLSCFR
jgi:hypothetical protein